jgi:hypothetical protein
MENSKTISTISFFIKFKTTKKEKRKKESRFHELKTFIH